jgi:hypothetical protein
MVVSTWAGKADICMAKFGLIDFSLDFSQVLVKYDVQRFQLSRERLHREKVNRSKGKYFSYIIKFYKRTMYTFEQAKCFQAASLPRECYFNMFQP